MKRRSSIVVIKTVFACLLSLYILFPISFVLINSLKTGNEANSMNFRLPYAIQWKNYIKVINEANIVSSFFNSLLMAFVSAAICLIATSMAAFVLSRNKTKFNKTIYNYFFMGLVAPLNYIMIIWVLKYLHLQNTYMGVILVYVALGVPFITFLFYGFIKGVPKELDEAAFIDGCGLSKLFFRIIFPLLKPVTITGFIFNFLGAWNDFITPLYLLNDQKKWGMINSIYNFFGYRFNEWNLIFADIIMTIIPVLILYTIGQRYIISGMMAGSVKG